ncbi:MAG: amino acid ABC transporter substrate-binding protein [Anaerolineae bacterium]|nr:amino acid ABC transporter substrate-binding protein [Anaerolineae bacterium]
MRPRIVGPPPMDATWSQIQRQGVVRVGMDASYPPFELVENGQYSGFDVDLAHALAERWDVRAEFVNIHFDGLYDALEADKIDLIISALPHDRMRSLDVLYSYAYFDAGQVLVARAADKAITGIADLKGQTIAVELGAEAHQLARRLSRDRGLDLEIMAERDIQDAVERVVAGQASALICDHVDALGIIRLHPDLRVVGGHLTDEPYVIAARLDALILMQEINTALVEWGQNGRLNDLKQLWFGAVSR